MMAASERVNLNRLSVFVAVVEAGSFTAAADRLGIAKTMVSAHMQRLESEVGASLMVRSTRRLALTEAGEAFYQAARAIVHAADHAIEAAASSSGTPRGVLRVNASIDYGAEVVAPVAVALQRRFPELRIELTTVDRIVDLMAEGIDVAIRVGQLADSGYRAARIARFSEWLVAHPALFGALPTDPLALKNLPFIALTVLPRAATWTFRGPRGRSQTLQFTPAFTANTAYAVRMAAIAGGGLAVLPDFAVAEDVAAGRLVHVLPKWHLRTGGVHAVYPATRHPPQKVRVLIDALREYVERTGTARAV